MRLLIIALIFIGLCGQGMAASEDNAAPPPCEALTTSDDSFLVCRFDPRKDEIRLFLRDGQGEYFGHFRRLQSALEEGGETLRFAMRARCRAMRPSRPACWTRRLPARGCPATPIFW
jgi:uncharacterized protein YigE (DUF2233 family)